MCAVEFNYARYGLTKEQWNSLRKDVQEECKENPIFAQQIASDIKRGADPTKIGTTLANLSKKSDGGPIPGAELERQTPAAGVTGAGNTAEKKADLESLKPKYNIADLENDKQLRKTAEAQWEEYFLARAKENPEEAKRDMVRILYNKEVAQIKGGLVKMRGDAKQKLVLKSKYLAEGVASLQEKEAYDKRIETEMAKYKANSRIAIRDYNALFGQPPHKNDPIDEGGHITDAQLEALVQMKALDAIEIDDDRLDEMAIKAVTDYKFNEGMRKANEYQEEIDKIKKEKLSPEAQRIKEESIQKDKEYARQIVKLLQEADTPEAAAYRKEFTAKKEATLSEIDQLKKMGREEDAKALEAELDKSQKEAKEYINNNLMDKAKIAEANRLTEERKKAREDAGKAIYEALDPKVKEKLEKLKNKQIEALKSGREDLFEITDKNIGKIAKIFAEAQVDKEIAENRYNKTVVHWDKDPSINENDGKRHTYLDKDIQKYVQEYPEVFGREPKEGETPDFTVKGKGYMFDSDKYKEQMLRMSNDNQLDNEYANDAAHRADYMANIKERKEVIDHRAGHPEDVARVPDRRFAGKCYKIAGIDIERDKTFGKRLAHVGVGIFKGAVMGGAAAALAEYLSTTKIVESKFFKIVEYSGSVPFAKMVQYKGSKYVEFNKDVTLKGKVSGTQDFSVEKTVSGIAEDDINVEYSGWVPYSEQASYGEWVEVVVEGEIPCRHTDYVNGVAVGEQINDHKYRDSKQVYVDGTVDVNGEAYYHGQKTEHVKIPYTQKVTVDGEVYWESDVELTDKVTMGGDVDYSGEVLAEGEAEYKGQVEASGTTVGRPKFDWNNVAKGAITGAIAGGLNAIADWGTIYDEGDRRGSIARKVLSEKNVDGRTAVLREPIIVPNENVELLEQDTITLPKTGETEEPKETEVGETEKCKAEAKKDPHKADAYEQVFDMKGKLLYDVIAKAYGITDPKELYEAIGIVKGWHGISQAERSKNIWIANLGLKGSLQLRNGKTFDLTPIKDRNQIDDYTKTDKPGVYRERIPATVESVGGQLVVYCPDSNGDGRVVATYNDYEDARLAAKYYNEHQEVPTPEQLEEMKNPKKKEKE